MIDMALVNMVVKDYQPFSIVEDTSFREFVGMLDPTYNLPSRQTLKNGGGKIQGGQREGKRRGEKGQSCKPYIRYVDVFTYGCISGHDMSFYK